MNENTMKNYINFPFYHKKPFSKKKRRESIKLIIKCKFITTQHKKKLILKHNNKNVQCPKTLKNIKT